MYIYIYLYMHISYILLQSLRKDLQLIGRRDVWDRNRRLFGFPLRAPKGPTKAQSAACTYPPLLPPYLSLDGWMSRMGLVVDEWVGWMDWVNG